MWLVSKVMTPVLLWQSTALKLDASSMAIEVGLS